MFVGIGLVTVPIVVLLYQHINASRARAVAEGADKHLTPAEKRALGDKAPEFRYTL